MGVLCTRQKSELTKTVLQNLESKPSLQVVMNSISSLTLQFKLYLKWNKSHLDVLSILIVAIIKRRTVNWTELATTFPGTAQTSSCYRRIQRFFKGVAFDEETFAQLIARLFSPEGAWMLSMDRTNWMFGAFKINILYLAINYKNMAIPILWTLLPKKGCSNTQERIDLLKRFMKIFPEQPIQRLLADREFKGSRWIKYLISHDWPFCIRIPVNTLVPNKHQNRELPVRRIFSLGIGESMAIQKPRKVWGQMVYLAGSRKGEELMAVICNGNPSAAIADYLQRWQIETMFQALKGRGFNMEETHLRDRDKLSKLLSVLALAFCWSYKTGEYVNEEHPVRIKTHGRKAQTLFRAGLDHLQRIFDHIETWVDEFIKILSLFFRPWLSKAS